MREGKDQKSIQSDKSTGKRHTQERQEVRSFPTSDHKATISRHHRRQRQTQKKRSTKEVPPWNGQ